MYSIRESLLINKITSQNRRAFTLAEVLITLGIIGVVAAMSLPSVLTDVRNKELETGLKKGYSSIEQALNMYYADEGVKLTAGKIEHAVKVKYILTKYIINAVDCGFGDLHMISNEDTCYPNNWTNIPNLNLRTDLIYRNYTNTSEIPRNWFDDGQFISTDSMIILLENCSNAAYGNQIFITIDVNGFRKPNRLGQDLFMFDLGTDGVLRPMGAPGTHYTNMNTYCSATSSSNMNGAACTYKAFTDKNFFKNLPK